MLKLSTLRIIKNRFCDLGFYKIKYKKMKKQPYLTEKHMNSRIEFCNKHIFWDNQWLNTIFSDEKKFHLDGPDGYAYYWLHLSRKEEVYSKNQNSTLLF